MYGQTVITYYKKEKYFSITQSILQQVQGNNVGQGYHVYPFTFQFPAQDLPSSFRGSLGKIVYKLEANLSRPMRIDSKAKAHITVSKGDLNSDSELTIAQHSFIDKKMKLFTSGAVGMDVNIARTGHRQGEGIQVVASIQNRSSRGIKPKYCLYKKSSFFAKGKRKVKTEDILKEEGEVIPPSAGLTVTRIITIPPTACASILNCSLIRIEYRLRVYLDVKYASDPEIKFPIVILPALRGPDREDVSAYPTHEAKSDMPHGISFLHNPTASGPHAPPPSYETYGMYPSLNDFGGKSKRL
ncbi:arrestin domain-containing protein 3-like [Pempheris klunzingeri]|uniref:arrestin domain-containing protein 3-like n=1 Tax=Pempheris klunzingeri TaxID=3127111 RepID=UPI00397EB5CD